MLTMEEALKHSATRFVQGEIVKGRVIEVRAKEAMVDIGYKSEGVISGNEFDDIKAVKVGDEVDVLIEKLEDKDGMVVLSKEKAEFKKNWDKILTICNEGGTITGKVKAVVKGGLLVNIGVEAFLPASQIDITPPKNLNVYVGNSYEFKVVKINQERQNIVLSRRELIEQERNEKRSKLLTEMMPGDIRKGTVKNITDFGAFIDLNGLDGLLHITDMSWGRVGHPSEMFNVGDRVEVSVLKYDRETGRISLGLKQKSADPWTNVAGKYPSGTRVKGRVVSLTDYGAFVELEPGVEGLVHVSEMSWTHEVRHPSRVVAIGDQVEAAVLNVDPASRKISLGMKQTAPNPWDMVEGKYPIGTRIEGKVKSLTDFGAFIGLDEGIDGLIHISDMSWTKHIKHPSEIFKKSQKVEAVVLRIDKEKERLSLGYKQLTRDPWDDEIPARYRLGDSATGKVSKVADFGIFVELEGGVEGLIHISEAGLDQSAKLEEKFKLQDEVAAKIIKVDREERKIALSLRDHQLDSERRHVDEYHASQGAPDQSLGRAAKQSRKRGSDDDEK